MVSIRASSSFLCFLSCTLLSLLLLPSSLHAQQVYVNNTQFECNVNHSNTLGFLCNGQQTKCNSYLIFRSDSEINSLSDISSLLNADSAEVAGINNASAVFQKLPIGREVLVPVSCSCSGKYYQHNSSYVLEPDDIYLRIANDTYQALTTCQALIAQNAYSITNLPIGSKVVVPLMGASCLSFEKPDSEWCEVFANVSDRRGGRCIQDCCEIWCRRTGHTRRQ